MIKVAETTNPVPFTMQAPKKISILGSTGSVGCSTISLIEEKPENFQVEVLTAKSNILELAAQAKRLKARKVVIADEKLYQGLKDLLSGINVEVAAGNNALIEAAAEPVDWVMSSIVGAAGLKPTLSAIKSGTTVALANKEALVCAGDLMIKNVQQSGATLLPVDSEHNAIFQVLETHQIDTVDRLILTASGGPFLGRTYDEMREVTREQALAHPNWDMGAKISIDSATMMNKGLELIEAYHLFPVAKEQIDILVHPQSIIHSMVEYGDGSILAQMGTPDMRTPISYALGWPDRHSFTAEKLDFAKIGSLTFEDPDYQRFPALRLAKEALEAGNSAPAILNAANEIAVESFLCGEIGFLEIAHVVEDVMNDIDLQVITCVEDVFQQDRKGRELARHIIDKLS